MPTPEEELAALMTQPEAPVETPEADPKIGDLIAQLPQEYQGVAEQIRRVYQSRTTQAMQQAKAPSPEMDMSFLDSIINGDGTPDSAPEATPDTADVWTDPYESKINALNSQVEAMKQAMAQQQQAQAKRQFEEFISAGADKIRQIAADTGLEPTDAEVQDILTVAAQSKLDVNRAFGAIMGEKMINTTKATRVTSKEQSPADNLSPTDQFIQMLQK